MKYLAIYNCEPCPHKTTFDSTPRCEITNTLIQQNIFPPNCPLPSPDDLNHQYVSSFLHKQLSRIDTYISNIQPAIAEGQTAYIPALKSLEAEKQNIKALFTRLKHEHSPLDNPDPII